MISLIALLTASCGFLNEMNMAQTLTAAMGGTALRYQVTFGLFTFSLGFGAWLFDQPILKKFSARSLLVASQVLMILLSVVSPLWISLFNPLLTPSLSVLYIWLCYLPILLTGFISGMELPALLELARFRSRKEFTPLAWDYVGMFAASALFPIYLLYAMGVYGTAAVAAALSFLSLLLSLNLPRNVQRETTTVASKERTPQQSGMLLGFIFLLSFCSFSYELIIAKILGDIIHDETLSYSLGVGIMLVGLGIGTYMAQKKEVPLKSLVSVELALVVVGGSVFSLLYALATGVLALPALMPVASSKWLSLLFFSPVPLVIGWLTGFELPLLLKAIGNTRSSLGVPLALNYFGALISGFAVPILLLPRFTPALALSLIACLNFCLLCLLLLQKIPISKSQKLIFAAIGAAVLIAAPKVNPAIEQLFLKTYYYNLNITGLSSTSLRHFIAMTRTISDIQRETTPYQFIDKVMETNPTSYFAREGFILFLNKQQQIDSSRWETYHESFVYGPANLYKKPTRSVLICGGGDGVLARVLLESKDIQKITLVELDPRMIELANTDADMLDVNNGALMDPRVRVVNDDAFAYVHQETEMFDAIYIDFPYPDTFELSRLFSIEMYTAVKTRLKPDGFIVLDAPIWRYVDTPQTQALPELTILLDTLRAAGFKAIFPYGTIEPFIFAMVEPHEIQFDYDELKTIKDSTFVNLVSLDFLVWKNETPGAHVNSVYNPQPFFKQ